MTLENTPIPPKRGVSNNVFDARAMLVGAVVFVLIASTGLLLKMRSVAEARKRTEIATMQFSQPQHTVEEPHFGDPIRGIDREVPADRPDQPAAVVEERPDIHMTTGAPSDLPTNIEVVQSPNVATNQPSDLKVAVSAKDLAVAVRMDPNIADAPEEITVVSDTAGWAMDIIAAPAEEGIPADLFKYNTPPPRDRPALYTFNQGPRPGRPIKQLPKAFGDQAAPSWGQHGPVNINLFGNGDFFRTMDRSGGVKARSAVEGALHWLAVHQGEDGLWHADQYEGQKAGSLADTGLSVLALLSGGNTTRKGEYRRNVSRGIEAIMRGQKADGQIGGASGENLYTHAICTIALCEAYGRARDERIGAAAQKAIDFCAAAQATDGGWRYTKNPPASDMSVSAWFIQSLKTAKLAQIKFDQAVFARAQVFMDSVTDQGGSKESNGAVGYTFQDDQRYNGHPALTAAAMLVRQFTGVGVKNHLLVKGADLTRNIPPTWAAKDFYYWYYATYAMHNMGGEYRIWWNQRIRDVLMENQSREGDSAGSWDPKADKWGGAGGRVYTTALGALCLEVYYRYSEALNSFGAAPDLDELFLE